MPIPLLFQTRAGSENLTLLLNSFPAKASCTLPTSMHTNSFPAKSEAGPSPFSDFADLGPKAGVGTPREPWTPGSRLGPPLHQGRALTVSNSAPLQSSLLQTSSMDGSSFCLDFQR